MKRRCAPKSYSHKHFRLRGQCIGLVQISYSLQFSLLFSFIPNSHEEASEMAGEIIGGLTIVGKTLAQVSVLASGSVLAHRIWKSLRRPKEWTLQDRFAHVWVIGKTRMGKTTTCLHMARQDMLAGHKIVWVECHGEAAERLLALVPEDQVDDVIYFAPFIRKPPVGFNPLKMKTRTDSEKILLADQLTSAFAKVFGGVWGPSTDDLVRMAILAVLERPVESTVYHVYLMLTDELFREQVLEEIQGTNPIVEGFWRNDFAKVSKTSLNPPLNKLRKFLSNPFVQDALLQTGEKSLDIDEVLGKYHLICNFAKGKVGEGGSDLLASFMLSYIQIAVFRRNRYVQTPVFIYCDEFQNFVNDSFPVFLSECAKFKIGLVLSHQYVDQLPERMQEALFGNIGSMLMFRIGEWDAQLLKKKLDPIPVEAALTFPKFVHARKLMIGGVVQETYVTKGVTHEELIRYERPDQVDLIIKNTQERWGGKKFEPWIPVQRTEVRQGGAAQLAD